MRRARRPSGFTLIEVLVALLIASVVASLSYTVLATAVDTSATVEMAGNELAADARFRALLADALRHPSPAPGVDAPTFVVAHEARGDRVTFTSRGIVPPLGTSESWDVEIWSDSAGVQFEARPSGSESVPVHATLHGASGLEVLTRDGASRRNWVRGWERPGRTPDMVALVWRSPRTTSVPLVVRTSLEETP